MLLINLSVFILEIIFKFGLPDLDEWTIMKKISFFLTVIIIFNVIFGISLVDAQSFPAEDQWIGIGSDWRVLNKPTELDFNEVMVLWKKDIEDRMEKYSFNTVRLAFAFPYTGVTTRNKIDFRELDQVLDLFDSYGIKVVLDLHNYNDMEGFFGSEGWIDSWVEVAERYKNDDRIVGFEIFNEPFGQDNPSRVNTWDSWISGGGSGIFDGTEGVASALAECVDAIRATGDNHAIIYPDPWWFRGTFGEVFDPQSFIDSGYSRENIVITMHPWFFSDNQSIDTIFFEFLPLQIKKFEAWNEYYDIWIGEFGISNGRPLFVQKTACLEIINYASSNGIGFNFWISKEINENREEMWNHFEEIIESSNYYKLLLSDKLVNLSIQHNELFRVYENQVDAFNYLVEEYNNLTNSHNDSLLVYNNLSIQHNELKLGFQQLMENHTDIINKLEIISYEYQQLEGNHTVIKNDLDDLSYSFDLEKKGMLEDFDKKSAEYEELSIMYDQILNLYNERDSVYQNMLGVVIGLSFLSGFLVIFNLVKKLAEKRKR